MRNYRIVCAWLLAFVIGNGAAIAIAENRTDEKWAKVLRQYQEPDGRLRYGKLKTDVATDKAHLLLQYVADLTSISEQEYLSWNKPQQMAFLINAYNALTVQLVVNHYPVKSIRKIGGFFSSPWKQEFFSLLSGKIKTLDAIEHEYLREQFREPLIHSAINCASISCPKLQPIPFAAGELDAQLQSAFREFVNDPARNRYEPAAGKLYLSEIFKWFGKDFDARFGNFRKAIETDGPPSARESLAKGGSIEWIDYNWSLNDADAQ